MSASAAVIELEGVRKSFGDQLVLDGVDLAAEAGSTLVIVGEAHE